MNRKIAWWALPLMLGGLMWGVKWRADHPTPTKADLRLRALLSKSSQIDVDYSQFNQKKYRVKLSNEELKSFVDCFYIYPPPTRPSTVIMGGNGIVYISCFLKKPREDGALGAHIYLPLDERNGKIDVVYGNGQIEHKLHPVTVKRWIELLLTNPRIGPELKARMNS